MAMQAIMMDKGITAGLELLVHSVESILTEVILRCGGLWVENHGLIIRILTHEIDTVF